ncbi:hypothetical protein A8L34_27035 [Bacillus sp. FJAT-27264]|uniref:hypothetical protein n=1 Tax=Paenibacillus sp. (strain DSM 101736 / FJAT-27264) TaxID=1850362 RepID=UPI0008080FBE|nr:hypothetical protein [Bacillus sp. FJAT-27264]OBZ16336.1 hypothetical protein A8L34_27035 [Bacillus sp. FJAT-27264]
MKQFKLLVLAMFVIFSIAGCAKNNTGNLPGNNSSTESPSAPQSSSDNSGKSNQPESKALDPGQYFANENNGTVKNTDKQFEWVSGSISVTSEKIKSKDVGPDSEYLGEILIKEGEHSYKFNPKNNERQFQSISLSADQKLLAISLFNGAGSDLFTVDLSNGNTIDLKTEIITNTNETIDTVAAYNWSPTGYDLAIAYGDTSSSKIAIYNADKNSFTFVPSPSTFISTAFVLWNKEGRTLDFVSEKPSDQYKLYRFDLQNNEVHDVVDISRDDISKLENLSPKYIGE